MKDDHVSWREWRSRFPGGLTWREFLGFIRDDSVMKTRLLVLVSMIALGVTSIVSALLDHWVLAIATFLGMLCFCLAGRDI